MDCNEARKWIGVDVDGETDVRLHRELQQHLRTCAQCQAIEQRLRARRTQLAALGRFSAPPALAEKIRASITTEASKAGQRRGAAVAQFPTAAQPPSSKIQWWRALGIAASLAIAAIGGFSWGQARASRGQLVEAALTNHLRSLQADHLTDVASTDRHTVKPWFAGKLDFSPPVVDLAAHGFPLVGGRLDRLNGRTVAALVYRRRQHAINVFVWPTTGEKITDNRAQREGFNVVGWSSAGFNFVAVSEIPADELAGFAETLRGETR